MYRETEYGTVSSPSQKEPVSVLRVDPTVRWEDRTSILSSLLDI